MIEFSKFKLVTKSESKELFSFQSNLLQGINESNFIEITLQVAILMTLPPVADYNEAIKILKAFSIENEDIRIFIFGSFLSSTWENHKENDFISKLNSYIDIADNEQKAIINYLNAYDIFMHDNNSNDQNVYKDWLVKSIKPDVKFVYNYYRLAQVSEKKKAKELLEKAFSNIEKVYSDEECKGLKIGDFISIDAYLKEHILGIELSQPNFQEIKKFYNSF